ncbi:MAG: hypothetical protein CSA76_00385 [Spirochaetales bacterium]|nr:MAG: hypothetical protein CSA76_00385 [Spirochaetales bacterium]
MDGDLLRAWKRLKKKHGWNNTEAIDSDLRQAMVRILGLPEDFGEELADYFLPSPAGEEELYRSEEVMELFGGTWKPQESALNIDDWEFLRDLVNAWARELDMDTVTELMRHILDNGGFRSR